MVKQGLLVASVGDTSQTVKDGILAGLSISLFHS